MGLTLSDSDSFRLISEEHSRWVENSRLLLTPFVHPSLLVVFSSAAAAVPQFSASPTVWFVSGSVSCSVALYGGEMVWGGGARDLPSAVSGVSSSPQWFCATHQGALLTLAVRPLLPRCRPAASAGRPGGPPTTPSLEERPR